MKTLISSAICLFMICTAFAGCGINIPNAAIDQGAAEGAETVTFSNNGGAADHGLTTIEVTDENLYYYSEYNIKKTGLVIIESKNTNELRFGDIIVSINGRAVNAASEIDLILKPFKVGDTVTVTVNRYGEDISVDLRLTEKVPDPVTFD